MKHIWQTALIVVLVLSGFLFNVQSQGKKMAEKEYLRLWEQVDQHSGKGLPKSALEVVDSIYAIAKTENNAAQLVKALLKRTELRGQFEEMTLEKSIAELEKEAAESRFPVTPVLHSVIAEMYWSYYQQNRWQIHERTAVSGDAGDDIAVWDGAKFVEKTVALYRESLKNAAQLKQTPLDIYDPVITKADGSRRFRPTLYDFLAHRALDFLMNDEPGITRPAVQFRLSDSQIFAPAEQFSAVNFETEDTLSFKFQALKILQDLIDFHLKDSDPEALIDVDLKRLNFARQNGVMPEKERLYLAALEKLAQHYRSNAAATRVSFAIAQFYFERSENYQRLQPAEGLNADYKNDRKTAIDICESANNRHPKSEGAANCRQLITQIQRKNLTLNIEDVNLPDAPFRGLVTYQNVAKAYLEIVSISPEQLRAERLNSRRNLDQWIEYYRGLPSVAKFSVDLPDDGDYHTHATEIKFPELPNGHYVVLVGSAADFNRSEDAAAYNVLWISRIGYVQKTSADRLETGVFVMDRDSGKPLEGATVQTWFSEYDPQQRKNTEQQGKKYITDKNGYFSIESGDGYRRSSFRLDISYKNDRLFLDDMVNAYTHRGIDRDIPRERTFFFTDRAIYRPGQTVYFKGLMLSSNGDKNDIITKRNTTVELFDVNGQKVSGLKLQTNEYGTFNGVFVLPSAGLTGQMTIRNENGNTGFSVEEYKRPRFEVAFDPAKGSFKLGETVTITGKAEAYAGASIDNADVQYRVVRQVSFPYWWDFWRFAPSFGSDVEVANGTGSTEPDGTFSIEFTAVDDPTIPAERKAVFTYRVYADVTDAGGETRSAETTVRVGQVALSVSLDLPENIQREKAPQLAIDTKNLNGEFEPASGEIVIYPLENPGRILRDRMWQQPDKFLLSESQYIADFPHDVYSNEDDFHNWKRGEAIARIPFDTKNEKNYALTNIDKWAQGKYNAELVTTDKFGTEIKLNQFFTVYSLDDKIVPENALFWLSPEKDSGEPNEVARIYWGSAAPDIHAYIEIYRKNVIDETRRIRTGKDKNALLLPIFEKDRGGFSYSIFYVKYGRVHTHAGIIRVPWTNKELQITYETFRDKLKPGAAEEWRLKITGPKGEKVAAELLAAMYDASLDAFRPHQWNFNIYNTLGSPQQSFFNSGQAFGQSALSASGNGWNTGINFSFPQYDRLNWHVPYFGRHMVYMQRSMGAGRNESVAEIAMDSEAPATAMKAAPPAEADMVYVNGAVPAPEGSAAQQQPEPDFSDVPVRANLNETAFFYPDLKTDENGAVILSFTMPEALTRWKFMGFAHTPELQFALTEKTVLTQKELMVTPNAPRFFREGDKIVFSGKVANLSDGDLSGSATLQLFDALSMQPIDASFGNADNVIPFSAKAGQSARLQWSLSVPEGVSAITYRMIAKTDKFSDGEENTLPVLTNRMLVTESLPLPIRGKQSKTFTLDKLLNSSKSNTLRHERVTLEFTSNPAWYAVQALPYLMEFPYECAEQIFSRYYANSIAAHIANSNPKIKRVFDTWRNSQPEALLSNLEKNQELKSLMLEETPWVMDAQNEGERKKRIALLFDLNRMSHELENALRKLQQMQMPSGGWPWFPGMQESRYITGHIVAGMGHLQKLGVIDKSGDPRVQQMLQLACLYLDEQMNEDYQKLIEHKADLSKQHIGGTQIQYLYARSYFLDFPVNEQHQTAFDFWQSQAREFWLPQNKYMQGMIALALHRMDDGKTPNDIVASLREHALSNEEFGMYWRKEWGFYWYEAPIETQALMIEVFDEITKDTDAVEEMRVWLLKQKQTQDWKTTKATAEACYALLLRGTDWLADDTLVEVVVGNEKIDPKSREDVAAEVGTGYFKIAWQGDAVQPEMGRVTVNKSTDGVAWGALYWQYFEQLDKITPHETPLKLQKALFLQRNTASGPELVQIDKNSALKPGDLLKVRIELRVDRDLEYVHMKDMRAAGFEPLNVISSTKFQGGLAYYESTKDAATHFFFDYLPKGTYVFEYPLRVFNAGDFSNGITTIQCMYAPEFTSHSEGIRVTVGERD